MPRIMTVKYFCHLRGRERKRVWVRERGFAWAFSHHLSVCILRTSICLTSDKYKSLISRGGQEHLKIKTRLIDEKFASLMGECVFVKL
jgi:hypothetical protein